MPSITIDGKVIEFKPGQTIIQAAADQGIDIPHFCWHPGLSVAGNCRVCLVEVEKMPKLAIACATQAADGMVVNTSSEKALNARNAVMEFILINHPLDCPICDEAGECKLQDYAYSHSLGESRFTEEKVHKEKRVALGPNVMFDGERCISCSRCIRFCDEIAGEKELTFVKRGDRVTITTFPGKQLDNAYAMCVTDICPVGALTSRDFRFQSRVWDMSETPTICTGCSRGCNTLMWVRSNQVMRLTPRDNEQVNQHWMCDHGRLNTFQFVNEDDRANGPQVRREGAFADVGWAEAYSAIATELQTYNTDEIAFIGSPFATCEDNYMLARFAKNVVKTRHIDFPRHIFPGSGDDFLIREDKSPNALGAELSGIKPAERGMNFKAILEAVKQRKIKALYVMEEDLVGTDPELEQVLAKLDLLIVHTYTMNRTAKLANIVLPAATYAEKNGTWINFEGRIQRIRPAVTTKEMERSLQGLSVSRLDKFGTQFDRWGNVRKIDARASWKIIAGLLGSFGTKVKYDTAEDVLLEMAKNLPEFKGLNYDVIGNKGFQLSIKPQKV